MLCVDGTVKTLAEGYREVRLGELNVKFGFLSVLFGVLLLLSFCSHEDEV